MTKKIDPKSSQTPFADAVAGGAPQFAASNSDVQSFAALGSELLSHKTRATNPMQLAADFSISTVEEVAGLAYVDRKYHSTFLHDVGFNEDTAEQTIGRLTSDPESKSLLDYWDRLISRDLELGCQLKLDEPPPPPADLAGPAPVTDLSLIDGFMPAIKHQRERGTCVSFTATACLEYHLNRLANDGNILDLSEQFTYWTMVATTGQHNLVSCYPLLATKGTCTEAVWPYKPYEIAGNDGQGPAPMDAITEAAAYCCATVQQIPARDVQQICDVLDTNKLVGIGIPVYRSWFRNPVVRQYGNIIMPIPGEIPEPIGHAVTLVGYANDPQFAGGGYFIVRNSWGTEWAEASLLGAGYGTIPFKYIAFHNWDAWYVAS